MDNYGFTNNQIESLKRGDQWQAYAHGRWCRAEKFWDGGKLDPRTGEYEIVERMTLTYGPDMMPPDFRKDVDTIDMMLKAMSEFAAASEWSDEEDDTDFNYNEDDDEAS